MAFRIATLAFALLCLFLLTEARKFDFLPASDNLSCHYVGTCANNSWPSTLECMRACENNGYDPDRSECLIPAETSTTANPSDHDQNFNYSGKCADNNDRTTNCADKGSFDAEAQYSTPDATFKCCCCVKPGKF